METTYLNCINAIANAEKIVNENHKSKFTYALEKFLQKNKHIRTKYNESVEDLRIEHASVDDKGNLLIDKNGSYSYTKDAYRVLTKNVRELNLKTITCEPYLVDEANIPKDLHPSYLKVLEGFVVPIPKEA